MSPASLRLETNECSKISGCQVPVNFTDTLRIQQRLRVKVVLPLGVDPRRSPYQDDMQSRYIIGGK